MTREDVIEVLSVGLNRHERKLNQRVFKIILPEFFARLEALLIDWREETPPAIRRQLFLFLKYRAAALVGTIFEIRKKYAEYTKRYSRAMTMEEKERHILGFCSDLGASPRRLRGDRKAFARWFGHDAITERYVRRHNALERELSFVLERIGALASVLLSSESQDNDLVSYWQNLDLSKTLKPLFAYDGDSRVTIAAFRCLSRALRALPANLQESSVDDNTLQIIYRCALHTRLDVWLQCEAVTLLESLSTSSLEKVLTRRLKNPAPDDDLFVRRCAVALLGRNLKRLPSLAPLLPVVAKDPSAYVRQGFAAIVEKLPAELASSWLRYLAVEDPVSQVRASAVLAGLCLVERPELQVDVLAILLQILAKEQDSFVLRVGCHVAVEGMRKLTAAGDPFAAKWHHAVLESLERLHVEAKSIPVRRWAAFARESIWCESSPEARALKSSLEQLVPTLKVGERRRISSRILLPDDDEVTGRVLAVLCQNDWGCQLDYGFRGWSLTRGDVFVFKPWRWLHEVRNPSPDKRQAFPHTIGRQFRGGVYAPSAILAELAETRVPGEPLFISEEGGWRPYLPLLDEFLAALARGSEKPPVKIFTSEGVTEIASSPLLRDRIRAFWKITTRYPDMAKLRNWRSQLQESPATYARAMQDLGFEICFRPHVGEDGQSTSVDPSVARFFPMGMPLLPPELWTRAREYFVSVYDNSLFELALFLGVAGGFFLGRHCYSTATVKKWRDRIPLVVGGWGTRGKSGTERLKAALFNALGYAVVSKTTGCEAMFLCAHAFGKTREMFLFRSYDKATIWEQRNVIRISDQLGAEVFLWECMALTPSYVEVLQQQWVRDDISTITNTYPDHEDLQGPAGINIPEVIGVFCPTRSKCITTEEVMLPVLTEIAREKKTPLRCVSWLAPGLIAPDVLKRFPYDEHPCNVALVLALADELGISEDFALKELADRVVPDLGVLKTSPVATVRRRRLQFSNGCSANERHGTISNWVRCGFDVQDPVKEPGVWITTVVNNRADRVPRSLVFARILVEDIYADRHFLIGGNLSGLVGYIRQSWEAYAATISLWPKDASEEPVAVLREMARRFRVPFERGQVIARLRAMVSGQEATLDVEFGTDGLASDLNLLRGKLNTLGLADVTENILKCHKQNLENFEAFESFRLRVESSASSDRSTLDQEFRALLFKWFEKKIVVVHDYYMSGDQIINLIAEETPPGYLNRIMGVQNIKGTGLDFVYRWQAWDTCWRSCEQLQSKDLVTAERGLRALSSFHEYGILCEEHVREVLARVKQSAVAQNESFQAELSLIFSNFDQAIRELGEKLKAVRRQAGGFERMVSAVENFFDAGDAVKRRKKANQIYRDLVDQRISYERAALELQGLNKRQKGGWLLHKIADAQGAIARRVAGLLVRGVK